MLRLQSEDDRALGLSTQRAVAAGRRTIVDAHCCLRRLVSRLPPGKPAAGDGAHAAEIAGQLTAVHHRLLRLSSDVEREIDRLDILCAELERFVGMPDVVRENPS
jgi:hypothetical protein